LEHELEELYRSGYERFVRVAWAITGGELDARDAVQEAFVRALKGLGGFSGEGALEGWVWRIVVNAALAIRAQQVPESVFAEEAAPESGGVDEEVRRWISRLPERQRVAVFLRYYADLDYRAIGEALGIEPGTVSATLGSAHATLRRQLAEAH
jgi:RNA polymerase sigma factor (sigma-70 family)